MEKHLIIELEELKVYEQSMKLGEGVWIEINKWDKLVRYSIGVQLTRSVHSIAANLSEGFGRFHYGEKINFAYYSKGSLFETKTWLTKAYNRA